MDNNNIKYNKMKDGIYRANNGISYFVLNEKILIKVLGKMYKTTKMFLFADWAYPLTDEMKDEFEIVYNKVKQW